MFVFCVRHYLPNTIHRHYSSARIAMIVRCGLRGTKFGSFVCACFGVCVLVVELEMPKAFGLVRNSVGLGLVPLVLDPSGLWVPLRA